MPLSDIQFQLIDGWQKGFPLHPEPYAEIAFELGVSELAVLGMLKQLGRAGILSRVGAVLEPNTAGASTLAALAVPPERLEEVADIVNAEPGINHNYEREHRFNLWCVATGRDRAAVNGTLARISNRSGLDVLDLPLRTAYHIDLGFSLRQNGSVKRSREAVCNGKNTATSASPADIALLRAMEDGLPICPRPYRELARRTGASESSVMKRLRSLGERGIIKRLGLVVRHRELGYLANAMVVWDIPEESVDQVGEMFARIPFVTLCYRRDRHLPDWPYNLFCMIHGHDRDAVCAQVDELRCNADAANAPMDILFSVRRFKQRGARLSAA